MDLRIPFAAFQLSFAGLCLMISFIEIQKGNCAEVSNTENELAMDIFSSLQTLRSEVQSLKPLRSEVQRLKAEIGAERERRVSMEERRVPKKKQVSFYAQVRPSITKIEEGDTIVFSRVITNSGQAYNPTTGEFKVPFAGTYVFYSNIVAGYGKFISTYLNVNGKIMMNIYSGSKFLGSGSNMAALELKSGDIVSIVKNDLWGTKPLYVHHLWSTFSGFLLY